MKSPCHQKQIPENALFSGICVLVGLIGIEPTRYHSALVITHTGCACFVRLWRFNGLCDNNAKHTDDKQNDLKSDLFHACLGDVLFIHRIHDLLRPKHIAIQRMPIDPESIHILAMPDDGL